jgi:hypothetical protein
MRGGSERDTRRGVARRLWSGWKRIGRKIGDVQARALLTLVYLTLVAPFALAVRWGADPLTLKPRTPRGWRRRAAVEGDPVARARRQF